MIVRIDRQRGIAGGERVAKPAEREICVREIAQGGNGFRIDRNRTGQRIGGFLMAAEGAEGVGKIVPDLGDGRIKDKRPLIGVDRLGGTPQPLQRVAEGCVKRRGIRNDRDRATGQIGGVLVMPELKGNQPQQMHSAIALFGSLASTRR